MDNRINNVFDKIHAEDQLKRNTLIFLHGKIEKRQRLPRIRFAAACACFVVFLVLGTLSYDLYYTPMAYIDIDVNPSIELSVNRYGKVIRSSAYNDDGTEILNSVKVIHLSYNEALETLLAAMDVEGYFQVNDMLYVTVQSNESIREERILYDLRETIDTASANHHYNIDADLCSVTEEVKHRAATYQVSPAKYLAMQDLLAVDPSINFEECKEHSIRELQHLAQRDCSEQEDHIYPHEHNNDHHSHESESQPIE